MRFSNDDTSLYTTCTQLVAPSAFVREGTYSLSAWARPVNLTGDDSGATVCAEYLDSDSKYLGGTYPAGVKGTRGWQQIQDLFGVPREAASLRVSVYVRNSMVGPVRRMYRVAHLALDLVRAVVRRDGSVVRAGLVVRNHVRVARHLARHLAHRPRVRRHRVAGVAGRRVLWRAAPL
jgi:hypothetical protein